MGYIKMQMNKKPINFNQSGASAIMFALFFIMIISLISVGFATLSRRDQRATIDKTLSSQAQLAAESGINAANTYISEKVKSGSLGASDPGSVKNGCEEVGNFKYPVFSEGVRITCVTWDAKPEEAVKTLSPYDGWSFTTTNFTGKDLISWKVDAFADSMSAYDGAIGRTNLKPVQPGKLPILKVASVSTADITNTAQPKIEVYYLIPASKAGENIAPTPINLEDGPTNNRGNAAAFNVTCSANGECKADLNGYANASSLPNSRLYYFQIIGDQSATLKYQALSGAVPVKLDNIQTKIDVNAIAQDQSKRLISYISTSPGSNSTWQPYFGALADSLCKDIKVDGANNFNISGGGACPAP